MIMKHLVVLVLFILSMSVVHGESVFDDLLPDFNSPIIDEKASVTIDSSSVPLILGILGFVALGLVLFFRIKKKSYTYTKKSRVKRKRTRRR